MHNIKKGGIVRNRDIKILPLAGFVVAAIFLAALQLNGILLAFGQRISYHIAAAQGIIQGYPHWRIYQSRILGPFFVEVVRNLSQGSFGEAYLLAMFILLAAFFLVLMVLARRLWDSTVAAFAVAVAACTFNSILMQGLWLYPWDYIDLIIFTLLTWAIVTYKPGLVASILAFEIFNREIIIILSIWFMVDAIFRLRLSETGWFKAKIGIRYRQFFVALGLLGIGYIVTEFLRDTLLIKEMGPEIFPKIKVSGWFVNVQLIRNLQMLGFTLTHPFKSFYSIYNVFIFGMPILALRAMAYQHIGVIRVGLLYLVLWGFTVTFGLIYEMRVWVSFVPFLVLVAPIVLTNYRPYYLKYGRDEEAHNPVIHNVGTV